MEAHKKYKEIIKKLDELVNEKAIPYEGDYKFYDDSSPDRFIQVNKSVLVKEFNLEYTYLDVIYTNENIQSCLDDGNNTPIEGKFYDVYSANIYINEDYYNQVCEGKILKSHYINVEENGMNVGKPILLKSSYIFYNPKSLRTILKAIKSA